MERDFDDRNLNCKEPTLVGNIIVAQIDYEGRPDRKQPGSILLALQEVSGGVAKFVACHGGQAYSFSVKDIFKTHRAGILVFNKDIEALLGKEGIKE